MSVGNNSINVITYDDTGLVKHIHTIHEDLYNELQLIDPSLHRLRVRGSLGDLNHTRVFRLFEVDVLEATPSDSVLTIVDEAGRTFAVRPLN